MKNPGYTACIALALLGLAACSKPSTSTSSSTTTTSTTVTTTTSAPSITDLNSLSPMSAKPGLWELKQVVPGVGSTIATQMCTDAMTGAKMMQSSMAMRKNASCGAPAVQASGNTIAIDATCQVDGSSIASHTTITKTSDTSFHEDIAAKFTPAMHGQDSMQTSMDGTWLGPCTAGMKPGDMMVQGVKVNMTQ